MKKTPLLFIGLTGLLLLALFKTLPSLLYDQYQKSCDMGVGDKVEVWNEIEYLRPECWNLVSTDPNLVLQFGLGHTLELSLKPFPEDSEENALALEPYNVGTVYALASDFAATDVQRILGSLKHHPFSIAPTSCEVPDSTFAESLSYEWFGITFSLPFCWGAEEVTTSPGLQHVLMLTRGDESMWVWIYTTSDPVRYSNFSTNASDDHEVQLILNSLPQS